MSDTIINRLNKYLTTIQLRAYVAYTDLLTVFRRGKTDVNRANYLKAYDEFLRATSGKEPFEMMPLSAWR